MNGGQPPENESPAGGDEEQPGEPDRTWRIEGGIDYATGHGVNIGHETARQIADALHSDEDSALYALASSGTVDYNRLRFELLDIYVDETTPPSIRQWCDQLGAYVTERLNRGDTSPIEGWQEPRVDAPAQPEAELTAEQRWPWLEWRFLVGAKEPEGSLMHCYRKLGYEETLCGVEATMVGAPVYPRIAIDEPGQPVLDRYCEACVAEARRRWFQGGEAHGEPDP